MKLSPRYNDGEEPKVRISYLTRDSVLRNEHHEVDQCLGGTHSIMTWDGGSGTGIVTEEYREFVNENSLKHSWTRFISDLVERLEGPLYFYTLTFRWETEPRRKAVENAVDRFAKFARNHGVGGIIVTEKGSKFGRLHAHGILSGFGVRACQHFWETQFGYTNMEEVRDKTQVGAYIAKYCSKQIGTSEFKVIHKDRAFANVSSILKDRRFKWEKQRGSIQAPRSRMW